MSRHHIVPRGQLLQGPRSPRHQSVLATNFDEKHGKKGDFSRKYGDFYRENEMFSVNMVILHAFTPENGDFI